MTEIEDPRPTPDDRRRKAMSLALAGIDWQIIADQCGYDSRNDAIDDISTALLTEPVDALPELATKQLQIARLSRMLAGVWTKATRGDARSIEVSTRLIKELCSLQGVNDTKQIKIPEEEALSAYDELAARRPGTQSGPRRQRGRRRQAGPTA
jgi:hypothetical protein